MFDNQITMTAQIPFGIAMPTSAPTTAACAAPVSERAPAWRPSRPTPPPVHVVRERSVTGDAIRTPYPGTTAWSPPTS